MPQEPLGPRRHRSVRVTLSADVFPDGWWDVDLVLSLDADPKKVVPIAHGVHAAMTPRDLHAIKHAVVQLVESSLSTIVQVDPF